MYTGTDYFVFKSSWSLCVILWSYKYVQMCFASSDVDRSEIRYIGHFPGKDHKFLIFAIHSVRNSMCWLYSRESFILTYRDASVHVSVVHMNNISVDVTDISASKNTTDCKLNSCLETHFFDIWLDTHSFEFFLVKTRRSDEKWVATAYAVRRWCHFQQQYFRIDELSQKRLFFIVTTTRAHR